MAYEDQYRLSVHAVIFNENADVLFVKTTYGNKDWTLPGGAVDVGETVHETLLRECREELGRSVKILYLSGVYYHASHNSHAFVFRCEFDDERKIELSKEHSEASYLKTSELKAAHRIKVEDCTNFQGTAFSRKFE